MNAAWTFVLASYGIASLCLGSLTIGVIYRYRRAVRQFTSDQRTDRSV